MKKRVLSILLSTGLVLSSVMASVPVVFSAESPDPASYNTTVMTIGKNVATVRTSAADNYVYNEDLFRTDAREYNARMANMTYGLALASMPAYDRSEDCYNLQAYLEDNGFSDFEATDNYKHNTSADDAAVGFAHKTIYEGGKPYTLLAIVPRSGTSVNGWAKYLKISSSESDDGDYAGFSEIREKILAHAKQYIEDHNISGDTKLWGAGYSGGGGVMNLVAASIADDVKANLGDNINAATEDMYFYTYLAPNAAAPSADQDNAKYDCIHNLYADEDMISNIPANKTGFGKYGQKHIVTDSGLKNIMLKHLKNYSLTDYKTFLSAGDPDTYTPYKLDMDALESGQMSFVADNDSYLPYDSGDFIDLVTENISDICARESDSGTDHRAGFYKTYQEPVVRFVANVFYSYSVDLNEFLMGENAAPMLLSMYMTYITEKTDDFNEALTNSFNVLASFAEKNDGAMLENSSDLQSLYSTLKVLFKESDDPNQKYVLKRKFTNQTSAMNTLRNVTASLYSKNLRSAMEKTGRFSEDIIKQTADDDSYVMSYFLANVLFGNSLQSDTLAADLADNEQLKMAATMASNLEKFMITHLWPQLISWVRAGDRSCDDYLPPTEVQSAGYRRVYLDQPSDINITGIVKDSKGNIVAKFVNGAIVSKSDAFIGITTSDTESWLRLPASAGYYVTFEADQDCTYSTRLAEYSIPKGTVVREIKGDGTSNWSKISMKAGKVVMLSIPALTKTNGAYTVPSKLSYHFAVNITEAEAAEIIKRAQTEAAADTSANTGTETSTITVLKNAGKIKVLKAKAAKKSFTVKWKKLSKAKRKKFSKIQIQYSTDKKFRKNVKTKYVKSTKKSIRIKKLKSGKKYYVRMRAYVKKGNNIYVSKWSAKKAVKVK